MAAYDAYAQHPLFNQFFDADHEQANPFQPAAAMAGFDYHAAVAHLEVPYAYTHPSVLYADALLDPKLPIVRSPSTTSDVRATYEVPALHASGSVGSTSSSTVGSPHSGYTHMMNGHDGFHITAPPRYHHPAIVGDEQYQPDFVGHFHPDLPFPDHEQKLTGNVVDPGLISSPHDPYHQFSRSNTFGLPGQPSLSLSSAPSPVPSHHSYHAFNQPVTLENYGQSLAMHRETSVSSHKSAGSPRSTLSGGDDDHHNNRRCPLPDCGRLIKDLKAHMLTHESVRPQRCPIQNCEYYDKGFARKYDRNRHTLTHYKGTMVCGFCPGSGSSAEKSFNRADVFKRHLITVHRVEQNPPNSRKRAPGSPGKTLASYCQDATGKCSTCSKTFTDAQGFYEHLDDCVLKVVQEIEPSESVNAARLGEMAGDPVLQETFDRNHIRAETVSCDYEPDEDDDGEDDELEGLPSGWSAPKPAKGGVIGGGITKSLKPTRRGMTWSKGGVALTGKGRKRRKNYPASWGTPADKMKMKKRVLCVYDGARRLVKDDMMLHDEFEVRINLGEGDRYVTDLDVLTFERANAYHDATPEERAAWGTEEEGTEEDFLSDFMP